MQYLARREYSRTELHGKLLNHLQEDTDSGQCQDHQLDGLLDDLTTRGWLSDERAATQLILAKRGRFGVQRIIRELRQKGIAEELISAALPKLKETELEAAYSVWLKKFGTPPHDARENGRQIRFLQSRGFSISVIISMLKLRNINE